jgi:hypothetical protein
MNPNIITDFTSRECKNKAHEECYGTWLGLGFEIICSCPCDHIKKDRYMSQYSESKVGPRDQSIAIHSKAQARCEH